MTPATPPPTLFRQIAGSWLSMKTWVKCWLFFLNAVFLGALFFLDDPASTWILIAYAASGPLLIGLIIHQRGLTRLLGIAHLLPWVPLLVYLVGHLGSAQFGQPITPQSDARYFAYLSLLLVCLAICLALDAWDVVRYWKGERYVLGSHEAVWAGASGANPLTH